MTQAPTPGPLTDAERYEQAKRDFNRMRDDGSLPAPTAPVEASGSGSRDEALLNGLHARLLRTAPAQSEAQAFLQRQEALALRAVMDFAIAQTRPQPSGETREAVARLLDPHAWAKRQERIERAEHWVKNPDGFKPETAEDFRQGNLQGADDIVRKSLELADRILALLSARPLALGGQQGDWYAAEDIDRMVREIDVAMNGDAAAPQAKLCDIHKDILKRVTAPARAEAQDEGAATDDLVDRFAVALKAKLRAAGEKYGFDDAWKSDDWRDKLVEDLLRHIQKGDPRDVAAYCAFAWHHGWSLSNGVFPRAGKNLITPQDEGAAGEPVAKVVRKGFSTGSISWIKFGQDADLSDETPLYAHPSPTPAADDDRVRIAVAALEDISAGRVKPSCNEPGLIGRLRERAAEALAALKSTAAKEGGSK